MKDLSGHAEETGMSESFEDEYIEIDLMGVMGRMWRKAWAVILAIVLCGAAAFSLAYFVITPKYQARALMYVNNSSISVGSTTVSLSDLSASQSLVDTYIVILKTRLTLDEVIRQADLSYDYETLYDMIDAEAVNSTEVFEIKVTSEDPREAELIANTIVDVLPDKISEVVDGSSVRTVDFAVLPSKRHSPSLTIYTAAGLAIGLLASFFVALLSEIRDDQIHGEEDLLQTYGLPVLAVVPDLFAPKGGAGKGGYYAYYAAEGQEKT